MATTVGCTVEIYGTNATAIALHPIKGTVILDIHMRHRYQLSLPFRGVITLVDDILSLEFQYLFHIPLHVLTLPAHISEVVSGLNLDAAVTDYLKRQISSFAVNMAERALWEEGFVMVVDVVVLTVDIFGQDQVRRIKPGSMEMDGGDGLSSEIQDLELGGFDGGDHAVDDDVGKTTRGVFEYWKHGTVVSDGYQSRWRESTAIGIFEDSSALGSFGVRR
ncbi:hypothetical protein L1049_025433 [Liquidambar formosana]|uniref:Uncharacterized protein n=1 Tax=Liquidambar formosana TaxID=63359 RepID=A0AAP0NB90_LIQFO